MEYWLVSNFITDPHIEEALKASITRNQQQIAIKQSMYGIEQEYWLCARKIALSAPIEKAMQLLRLSEQHIAKLKTMTNSELERLHSDEMISFRFIYCNSVKARAEQQSKRNDNLHFMYQEVDQGCCITQLALAFWETACEVTKEFGISHVKTMFLLSNKTAEFIKQKTRSTVMREHCLKKIIAIEPTYNPDILLNRSNIGDSASTRVSHKYQQFIKTLSAQPTI